MYINRKNTVTFSRKQYFCSITFKILINAGLQLLSRG
nr:MAG TPA: hypothetical protein [Bacteriophage sp.]